MDSRRMCKLLGARAAALPMTGDSPGVAQATGLAAVGAALAGLGALLRRRTAPPGAL